MSSIFYEGSDGYVHSLGDDDSIKHYKYIKKIKTGSGWRYFYTPEEIRAYYKESKAEAKTKYDKEDLRAQRIADKRSNAAMNQFENRTNRDVVRLKRKAKNGTITEQDLKDFAKKTGKGAADYGKTAAKEQMKSSLVKNRNKIKRIADPITDTGRKIVSKPTSQINKDSSKKVNKGRSAVEKKINKNKSSKKKNTSTEWKAGKPTIKSQKIINGGNISTKKKKKKKKTNNDTEWKAGKPTITSQKIIK